jgi:hypothetical protein
MRVIMPAMIDQVGRNSNGGEANGVNRRHTAHRRDSRTEATRSRRIREATRSGMDQHGRDHLSLHGVAAICHVKPSRPRGCRSTALTRESTDPRASANAWAAIGIPGATRNAGCSVWS